MTITAIDVTTIETLAHDEAMRRQADELERTLALLRPTDGDDNFCFPGSEALWIHVNGCTDTNSGFDGASYQKLWPDGNTRLHPEPILFSPPRTGPNFNVNYQRMGFEAVSPGRPLRDR